MATVQCDNLPVSSLEAAPTKAQTATQEKSTYGQILKSSALVGGSSILNIAVGIVRTKAMALLLEPSGFGLFGLYASLINLTQTLAGMGVNSSGVRQIAEAAGSGDVERIGQTAAVLRRVSLFLGLLGAAFLIVFARQVSAITFGSRDHASDIAFLSIAVFLTLVSLGQGALIQGMRRIGDFAKMNAVGPVTAAACSIPFVYFWHAKGVVPALIAVAAMTLAASWWYSRKIDIPRFSTSLPAMARETSALLKLGFAFMSSGLMTMGVAYVVRIVILRQVGIEATGLYQSAWALGGLYVGFILQAMAADFYPRLTAKADDNTECNRLVNEQAQVGLLLAGPGVIATITLAPVVISLLYSARFAGAVPILRWICLGTILQVISWPMGFIIVAKARQNIFFWCEMAWTVVSLALAWVCVGTFGLVGAGIAFCGSYIFHAFLIYAVVHSLSGFEWSAANRKTGFFFLATVTAVFCGFYILPFWIAVVIGIVAAAFGSMYSLRELAGLVSYERIPAPLRKVVAYF